MMFGTREKFNYFLCSQCQCLQISDVPESMDHFYPQNYYSYQDDTAAPVVNLVKKLRSRLYLSDRFEHVKARLKAPSYLSWMRAAGAKLNSKILEVGCGTGVLLKKMRSAGFENLTGIDPFIPKDLFYEPQLKILKAELQEIPQHFDVIMFHHSFEHLPRPDLALQSAATKLNPNGCILIRVPLSDSYAFEHYQTTWVQLDAPRHLYLHSQKSLQVLAQLSGLEVSAVRHDSEAFQFWGSELFRRGIPLNDAKVHAVEKGLSYFSLAEIQNFKKRATELNKQQRGDQAAFYLRHKK